MVSDSRFCYRFLATVILLATFRSPLAAQEDLADGGAAGEIIVPEPGSSETSLGTSPEESAPELEGEIGVTEGDVSETVPETSVIESVPKGFFSYFSLSLGTAVLFFLESDALRSDPMPVLPSPHVALGFPFAFPGGTVFSVETTLDLYWTHYAYNAVLQRPVPAAIENRSSFVIGPILGLQVQGKTGIGPMVFVRYFLGMAFDLRIILIAEDLNESDLGKASSDTELTADYFWNEGRWFFPFVGAGVDFKISPELSFGVAGRAWVPLYRWRTNEDLPRVDGWRFGVDFRITFLNETPDKTIRRDIDNIKKKYAVERNDYAFVLYHLSKNPPFYGIEPSRLADEIAKTYKHSGLYREDRAGIFSGRIIDMFTDVPSVDKDYSYDRMGNVIRRR
ncbi:MAG: hypothetical protein LBG27_11585 [Spirochaetaceae bacterium]|nr:hypothetical protein [Spirochaetaceae bacterium]